MDMTVTETPDGVTRVVLDGRFDIAGAQAVDAPLTALAEKARFLVVDLARVTFLASLGVRTLMLGARTINRRGDFVAVCGASESVEKVLRSTGFDEIAGLYPDFDSAVTALKSREASFAGRGG
jgi:stage II sporulation protein AA (anti-sigma F factor antagonist)